MPELNETLFIAKNPKAKGADHGLTVALDDLMLTTDMPTSAGSLMLAGYKSLFAATADTRLREAGHYVAGKVNMGEFGIDLLGETSHFGPVIDAEGHLTSATAKLLMNLDVDAVVGLDVNGAAARSASLAGQVFLKPTYGCVSRFGTVAVACSGETVSITSRSADTVQAVLNALAAHDANDGTSLPEGECARITSAGAAAGRASGEAWATPITHVVLARGLYDAADADTKQLLDAAIHALKAQGITVTETSPATDELFGVASLAWNILMAAELCNNVSRFEGMKYGYHTENYLSIGELYTNSRTEAFGRLLKTVILYGSEVLATDNYDKCYDKGLRIRRLACEAFAKEFAKGTAAPGNGKTAGQTAILMPACSKRAYTLADVEANRYLPLEENLFTAPAAITGLPALVAGGVQLVGPAFSDGALLRLAGAGAGTSADAASGASSPAVPAPADGKEA